MVRVQVGEKDAVYIPPGHLDLIESLKRAAARVESESLAARQLRRNEAHLA